MTPAACSPPTPDCCSGRHGCCSTPRAAPQPPGPPCRCDRSCSRPTSSTAVAAAVRDGAAAFAQRLGIPLTEVTFGADRIPACGRCSAPARWSRLGRPTAPGSRPTIREWGPASAACFLQSAKATIPTAAVPATTAGIQVRRALEQALPTHAALVLPSAATVAPPPGSDPQANEDIRTRTIGLTCLAGLAGAPAVSLPLGQATGYPVGVCLLGRVGEDERLLAAAADGA